MSGVISETSTRHHHHVDTIIHKVLALRIIVIRFPQYKGRCRKRSEIQSYSLNVQIAAIYC